MLNVKAAKRCVSGNSPTLWNLCGVKESSLFQMSQHVVQQKRSHNLFRVETMYAYDHLIGEMLIELQHVSRCTLVYSPLDGAQCGTNLGATEHTFDSSEYTW